MTQQQQSDIEMILDQAQEQGWPFPKQFDALKKIGVTSYEVTPSTYDMLFYMNFGIWHTHRAPEDVADVITGAEFDKEALLKALDQRIEKTITYPEFLQHIARAGVDRYVVDMAQRTVTYYGIDEEYYYVQDVPEMV